jgi:hypothetical protein
VLVVVLDVVVLLVVVLEVVLLVVVVEVVEVVVLVVTDVDESKSIDISNLQHSLAGNCI